MPTKNFSLLSARDVASAAAVLALLTHGCAAEANSSNVVGESQAALAECPPAVPSNIAVPAGHKLAFSTEAEGDQIYTCTGSAWTLLAPDADLFKANGNIFGSHYAGPTWEALDGSTVVGQRVAGYTPDPSAIAWLLVRAISNSEDGRMSKVSYIQRLDTEAGLAPTTGCNADHIGATSHSAYRATYYFFEPDHGSSRQQHCK